MNCICKCCTQRVYCKGSAAYPCYLWQARRKKMPIWLLRNPPSSGKAIHLRGWACFSFLFYHHSPFLYSILPCVASPPSSLLLLSFLSVSLFLPSLYFNSDFVLFFCCVFSPLSRFTSLSLVSCLWGSCGSERRFGARLRQYFTLIKRMVGSTVWAAQEQIFFIFSASLPCLVLLWWERVHIFHSNAPSSSEAAVCGFALLLYIF